MLLCDGRVEVETARNQTRCGNHQERLGHNRTLYVSQYSNPDTEGMTPDPAYNNINTRSSQPSQVNRTPDLSYPLIFCISFPSSSCISVSCPSLYHHRRIQS